jgi:chromosomal replication initiation ATPase DnaA
MSERPMFSNRGQDLWARLLETMKERVGLASFETWFRPIVLAGWDETSCKLVVPNPFFRRCFLDNYSDILQQAMDQLVDTPLELQVSAAEADAVTDQL